MLEVGLLLEEKIVLFIGGLRLSNTSFSSAVKEATAKQRLCIG